MHKGPFTFIQNYSDPCFIYTTFLGEQGTKHFWERIRQWSLHCHTDPCFIYTTFLGEQDTKHFWERIRQWSLHFHAELFRNKNTSKHYNYTQHSWERKEQNKQPAGVSTDIIILENKKILRIKKEVYRDGIKRKETR